MRVRFLLLAVCLAVFAQFAVAAPPQITFVAPAYKVTVTPGATIAFLYAIEPNKYASGTLIDSDSDGTIIIDVGVNTLPYGRGIVAVDVATGEYGIESSSTSGHNPGTILKGPSGAFTELMVSWQKPVVLWVRPGMGAWSPAGVILPDLDQSATNYLTIGSVESFQPLGSSPARPAAFARGDLFFDLESDGSFIKGGLVDPLFDQIYGGAINFGGDIASNGLNGPNATEGQPMVFTILRLYGSDGTVSVRCCAFNEQDFGNAKPGLDFTPVDTIVTFGPGELIKHVLVPTVNDDKWEPTRYVVARMSDVVGPGFYGPTKKTVKIVDDDPAPVAGIEAPDTVTETDGDVTVNVAVTVSGAHREPITIEFYAAGKAQQNLVFQPGETRKEFVHTVPGDNAVNSDYKLTFAVEFEATRQRTTHILQVVDDELPAMTLAEPSSQEGTRITLKPAFSPFAVEGTQFRWTTVDGTAKAGTDYVAASGTFKPGTAWEITLLQDAAVEGHETFYIDLTDVQKATAAATRIAVTVLDDDGVPAPVFSPSFLQKVEGNGNVLIRTQAWLIQTPPLSFPITYEVQVTPGTATWQTDFSVQQGPVTIPAGQTSVAIDITIRGDEIPEADETFTLSVAGKSTSAVYTIVDDDSGPLPSVSIEDGPVAERTGRNEGGFVRVRLSAASGQPVSVNWTTADGTAKSGSDYLPGGGTITFAPGETMIQVTFQVIGDAVVEPVESFEIRLSNPVGATLGRSAATVTITDDDTAAPKPGRARSVRH